jgi:H-type lectin domain
MNITIDVKHGAVKRALALAGGLAVIGGVVAIAHAVPTMFSDGEVLTAAQLNANFADLEERVGTLEADKVVLQTGTVGDSLQNGAWTLEETGDNLFDVPVTFSPAFPKAPKVLVVLKNVDAGTTAAHMMIDASAMNVTKNGFTIRFSDYSDSSIWAANATWIAYTD